MRRTAPRPRLSNAAQCVGAALFVLTAPLAVAQPLVVGHLGTPATPLTAARDIGVFTAIDTFHPANHDGTVGSAVLLWSAAPCPGAVKIKFLRPLQNSPLVVQYLDERGPFDISATTSVLRFTPPVAVHAGDLIGVTALTTCGLPLYYQPASPGTVLIVLGDFRGTYAPPTIVPPPLYRAWTSKRLIKPG